MGYQYKVRCDKHQLKPYEYCEICELRTKVQSLTERFYKSECTGIDFIAGWFKENFLILENYVNHINDQVQDLKKIVLKD